MIGIIADTLAALWIAMVWLMAICILGALIAGVVVLARLGLEWAWDRIKEAF